jgi:hypothetical protein
VDQVTRDSLVNQGYDSGQWTDWVTQDNWVTEMVARVNRLIRLLGSVLVTETETQSQDILAGFMENLANTESRVTENLATTESQVMENSANMESRVTENLVNEERRVIQHSGNTEHRVRQNSESKKAGSTVALDGYYQDAKA